MLYLYEVRYTDDDFETVNKETIYDLEVSRGLIRSLKIGSEHAEYQISIFKEMDSLDWVKQNDSE